MTDGDVGHYSTKSTSLNRPVTHHRFDNFAGKYPAAADRSCFNVPHRRTGQKRSTAAADRKNIVQGTAFAVPANSNLMRLQHGHKIITRELTALRNAARIRIEDLRFTPLV